MPATRHPVIVITGASQGIGAALAQAFAAVPGARLALLARNGRRLQAVAATAVRAGARAEALACDVTDADAVAAAAKEVERRLGPADVLVNNAGLFRGRPLLEMPLAEFDELIAVNLRSVFIVSRAFLPAMVRRRRGHVFHLSSIAGREAYPNGAGYSAAKFGVAGLAAVMRRELRAHNIQVTTVYPGATYTPSWRGAGVPAARMMPAQGVARAILDAWRLGPRTVIEELVLRPPQGDV